MSSHPLSYILKQHLSQYRGGWVSKLTPDLRQALEEIDTANLKRAATILIHGDPVCAQGRERPFKRIKDGWQFCASNGKCSCFMDHFHKTSEETNLRKRGVKNAAQSEDIKSKMRATCLKRYGVEYSGASEERKKKAEETNLVRYGAKNVFASEEIKEHIRQKVMDEYGVEHISQTAEHQLKIRNGVRKKYGVDHVSQHPNVQAKMRATNMERYGGVAPACSAKIQQHMRDTMDANYGGHVAHLHVNPEHRIRGEDDFRERFAGRKAAEISIETGYHPSMIHRYANRWYVALDHTGGSKRGAENAFAARLETEGLVFERNCRILLPEIPTHDRRTNKEVDFFFPEQKLGIEFCGVIWHSDAFGRGPDYHKAKLESASRQGVDLIQVFEDEWNNHPEAVIATIKHRLGKTSSKIFARKCRIVSVNHTHAMNFYDHTHVYGGVAATKHIGLDHNGQLMACMSFKQARKGVWELVRYATVHSVVGGASRLLTHFERHYEWQRITSFVDLRWSKGDLYWTLGFTLDKDGHLLPNYMYVIGGCRIHKSNLRKTSKRFAKYIGTNMTERQMAEAEGIPRVYDAGKLRVVKYNFDHIIMAVSDRLKNELSKDI